MSRRTVTCHGGVVASFEGLEGRTLFSALPTGTRVEQAFERQAIGDTVQIDWAGQSRRVLAGQWVVTVDEAAASPSGAAGETAGRATGDAGDAEKNPLSQQAALGPVLKRLSGGQMRMNHNLGGGGLFVVNTPYAFDADHTLAVLRRLPGFISAEPNGVLEIQKTPNDQYYGNEYGLPSINAPAAWDVTTGSASAVVGVIDTGIDVNHPDLLPNLWTNPGEIEGDGIDNDHNGYVDDVHGWNFYNNTPDVDDLNGHGTHVSGTIAAAGNNGLGVTGVNWNAKIMALKIGGTSPSSGSLSVSAAVSAINYATMMNGRGVNIHVTNSSWGGPGYSTSLKTAIDANAQAGMLFVTAAGNDGRNSDGGTHSYPSDYTSSNIISVANITSGNGLAVSSNYGRTSVDLGAPGTSILSTYRGGGYAYLTGTSMASPHVAGAAALLFGAYPDASASDVKAALLDTVTPLSSLAGRTVTGGKVNLRAALDALKPATPPAPPTAVGASADGSVFNDANRNGRRDEGEAGLAGVTAWIDYDNDKQIDANEPTTTSDIQGNFKLQNITGGSATRLRVRLPDGATQITPTKGYGYSLDLRNGASNSGKTFGLYTPESTGGTSGGNNGGGGGGGGGGTATGSIRGFLFSDSDRDGKYDASEPLLAGRKLWLDLNDDGRIDSNEKVLYSDTNGAFTFDNLAPGTYHVRRDFPPGYVENTPARYVTIPATGGVFSDVAIGARKG